jgi:hypothetical protein
MCLYGPPYLARDSTGRPDGIADLAAYDDGDDLEFGEVLLVGDPRLQPRDVVALDYLEAAL